MTASLIEKLETAKGNCIFGKCDNGLDKAIAIVRQHEAEQAEVLREVRDALEDSIPFIGEEAFVPRIEERAAQALAKLDTLLSATGDGSATVAPVAAETASQNAPASDPWRTEDGRPIFGPGSPHDIRGHLSQLDPAGAARDGWIDWPGGECPVPPDTVVEYEMRDSDIGKDRAGDLRWNHRGHEWVADITRYRIVREGEEG